MQEETGAPGISIDIRTEQIEAGQSSPAFLVCAEHQLSGTPSVRQASEEAFLANRITLLSSEQNVRPPVLPNWRGVAITLYRTTGPSEISLSQSRGEMS